MHVRIKDFKIKKKIKIKKIKLLCKLKKKKKKKNCLQISFAGNELPVSGTKPWLLPSLSL